MVDGWLWLLQDDAAQLQRINTALDNTLQPPPPLMLAHPHIIPTTKWKYFKIFTRETFLANNIDLEDLLTNSSKRHEKKMIHWLMNKVGWQSKSIDNWWSKLVFDDGQTYVWTPIVRKSHSQLKVSWYSLMKDLFVIWDLKHMYLVLTTLP